MYMYIGVVGKTRHARHFRFVPCAGLNATKRNPRTHDRSCPWAYIFFFLSFFFFSFFFPTLSYSRGAALVYVSHCVCDVKRNKYFGQRRLDLCRISWMNGTNRKKKTKKRKVLKSVVWKGIYRVCRMQGTKPNHAHSKGRRDINPTLFHPTPPIQRAALPCVMRG